MGTQDATGCSEELLAGSAAEIELAVKRGDVSFPMLLKLLYLREQGGDQREPALYQQALSLFMDKYGGINESFYADEFVAGALLTKRDELFFNIWWDRFKFDTIPARSLEADINDLRLKIAQYLNEDHRRICTARLFRLYKTLISSLRLEYYRWSHVPAEEQPGNTPSLTADLKQIREELETVRDAYMHIGLARGQVHYVAAAASGTAVVVIAAMVAAVLEKQQAWVWSGAIAGGAVGALLSVLERLTRGELKVEFQTGFAVRFMSGISRPIVGALSGLALLVLIKGSVVLTFVKPPGETDQALALFFAGIAFIAGFSERFLKDVLGNAGKVLRQSKEPPARDRDTSHSAAKR